MSGSLFLRESVRANPPVPGATPVGEIVTSTVTEPNAPTEMPTITVCTSTYNRARLLPRVAESLEKQTFRDFEWVVIDDGSTDDTDAVLKELAASVSFPVVATRFPVNKGVHFGVNHGLRTARGKYFIQLDSDDWLAPQALERYLFHWNELIRKGLDQNVLSVWSICVDENGNVCGTLFPESPILSDHWTMIYRWKNIGDKKGMALTAFLRQYPFVEKPFLTSFPWLRMPRTTKMLFINEPLYVYTTPNPVDSISRGMGVKKAETVRYRSLEMLNLNWDFFRLNPSRFMDYSKRYAEACQTLGIGRVRRYLDLNPFALVVYALSQVLWLLLPVVRKLRGGMQ
jgi:glycosyltransferase involved in cell wall biosynthesis